MAKYKHSNLFQLTLIAALVASLPGLSQAQAASQAPTASTAVPIKTVHWEGNVPPEAQAHLDDFAARVAGKSLTQPQSEALAAELTEELRKAGYPLSLVLHTIESRHGLVADGILRLRVFKGEVGKISVGKNSSPVSDARILATTQSALCGGQAMPCTVTNAGLERAALLLGDLPGVTVAPFNFSPQGVDVGQTALVIDTTERDRRLMGSVSLDNYGVSSTGTNRLGVSLQASNLFHIGDTFSVGAQTTNQHQNTGMLAASIPVMDNGLRLQASASRTSYPLESVNAQGTATNAQLGLSYPLTRAFNANWSLSADAFGTVSKQTVAGQDAFPARHLNGVRLGVAANSGDATLDLSKDFWAAGATLTLGNVSQALTSADQSDTIGRYQKFAASLAVRQTLWADAFVLAKVKGQLARSNLDGSEALSVGGPGGMRAYPVSEGALTEGVQLNVDLRRSFRMPDGSSLMPGFFIDYTNGRILHTQYTSWQTALGYADPNQSNHRAMTDAGFAIDWVADKGLTAGMSIAWKLPHSEDSTSAPGKTSARVFATLGMRF